MGTLKRERERERERERANILHFGSALLSNQPILS